MKQLNPNTCCCCCAVAVVAVVAVVAAVVVAVVAVVFCCGGRAVFTAQQRTRNPNYSAIRMCYACTPICMHTHTHYIYIYMANSILLLCPKPAGHKHCKTTVIANCFINSCCC